MARPAKAKAIEHLRKARATIPELKQLGINSTEFKRWHRDTKVAIEHVFCDQPNKIREFPEEHSFMVLRIGGAPESESQRRYISVLGNTDVLLESMIDEIEKYWEEDEESSTTSDFRVKMPKSTNKVFVIHGHDESARETVARFLEKLELEPVILHEQPNKGRTIIEKFEKHAQVGFAVVLLTPDDVGSLKGEESNLKTRARQNVIFEFGYFIGKLGRNRVCALTKGDVEIPSDYDGVVYVPLDDHGAWKMSLVKELKAAEFDVDANFAL